MKLKKFFSKDTAKVVDLCIKIYEHEMDWAARNKPIETHFTKLCGICKTHHVHVNWRGKDSICQPDRWDVYKNGKHYFFTIDGLRFDGSNANCCEL